MAHYFLDTSALAKRYLPEVGSRWIQDLCATEVVSVSALVIVEINSTLARRVRETSITSSECNGVLRRFRHHLRQFTIVDVSLDILNAAGIVSLESPASVPLRALDAIHLASAQAIIATGIADDSDPLTFVSADARLLAAAEWAGLTVDNPANHP